MLFRQIVKSFFAAFSLYSKIPLPSFRWDSEDMKFHLCFFPFVGAVIGLAAFFWYRASILLSSAGILSPDSIVYPFCSLLIPLLISGGFHLDGFMDTMDALHSYGDRQKKLEILKDPHVGAFSIISLMVFLLALLAALSVIFEKPGNEVIFLCHAFFVSRILSALSVLLFPKAKKDGMLAAESRTDRRLSVIIILFMELLADFLLLAFYIYSHGQGLYDYLLLPVFFVVMMISFIYYYLMSMRQFGGISGDLSGFFVCISEGAVLLLLSVLKIFFM